MDLVRKKPEEMGVNSRNLAKFLDVCNTKVDMHSFMLIRHGCVISEAYWNPHTAERKHSLFSASKSFTAMAVGFAVQDGLMTDEDLVTSFFPDIIHGGVCENMQKMRVKHLLTMCHGMKEDPHHFTFGENTDWIANFLLRYVDEEPGKTFVYSTHASYVLAAIVQRATGRTVFDYLNEKLFQPLNIQDIWWEKCPQGVNVGGWGIAMRTEDFAKFGMFLLGKGSYQGRQLLDRAWMEKATSALVDNSMSGRDLEGRLGYGYQIWRGTHNSYSARGGFGQYTIAYPDYDAVMTFTCGEDETLHYIFEAFDRYLVPAFDAAGTDPVDLTEIVKDFHVPYVKGDPINEEAAGKVSGKLFAISPSHLEYQQITFQFGRDKDRIVLRYKDRDFRFEAGHDGFLSCETGITYDETDTDVSMIYPTACSMGAWRGNTYELKICFDEAAFTDTLLCTFEENVLIIDFKRNAWFKGKSIDCTLFACPDELLKKHRIVPTYRIYCGYDRAGWSKPLHPEAD